AVSQEQMEKIAKSMRNACLQKIDTTEELVAGIKRGEFPDDPNLECYTHCIMKTMRSFKNNEIDFKMVMKQIDASMPPDMAPRVKAAVRLCKNREYDTEPCKMTYQYTKCVYEADPEVFFFP
ncbi:General odorant-binding protein 19a, partial [Dufourea novaeangliae]